MTPVEVESMSKQKAAVGLSGTLIGISRHPGLLFIFSKPRGRIHTETPPSDFSESLEVYLVFCIFEEILLSGLLPDQRSLVCRSAFRDLINLILRLSAHCRSRRYIILI